MRGAGKAQRRPAAPERKVEAGERGGREEGGERKGAGARLREREGGGWVGVWWGQGETRGGRGVRAQAGTGQRAGGGATCGGWGVRGEVAGTDWVGFWARGMWRAVSGCGDVEGAG